MNLDSVQKLISQRDNLKLLQVVNSGEGLGLAKKIIYDNTDPKTVLFLSGGSTPKQLYETFAKEAQLKIGAAAVIDERYGLPYHDNSNEKMMRESGLLSYLQTQNIAFYPVLKDGSREQVVSDYDETTRYLFSSFPKSIGILGIGTDGHTAGIAPNREGFISPIFNGDQNVLVSSFKDNKSMQEGGFGERITLTFKGLENLDFILILAFGENKKEAFKKMFTEGSIEQIPARFFLLPQISQKTLLITDQKI